MGKRKASLPTRVDETKRQQLSWNLNDLHHNINIINNDDPAFVLEKEQAEKLLTEQKRSNSFVESTDSGYISCSPSIDITSGGNLNLQQLIDSYDFFISVYPDLGLKPGSWSCQLGEFYLKLNGGSYPKELPNSVFWLYVSEDSDKQLIYCELVSECGSSCQMSDVYYHEVVTDLPFECFNSLQLKSFRLVSNGYNADSGKIHVYVYALDGALTKLTFPSEGFRPRKTHMALKHVMQHFHKIRHPDISHDQPNMKEDINALYEEIKENHSSNPLKLRINVQHPCLKPRLREYQKQAVFWMLSKEGVKSPDASCTWTDGDSSSNTEKLHGLYEEFKSPDGQLLYYNRHGGYLVREKPKAMVSPPGGILADEMGLGKTVEVLSCMLLHPRPDLPEIKTLPVIGMNSSEINSSADPTNIRFPTNEDKKNGEKSTKETVINKSENSDIETNQGTESNLCSEKSEIISEEKVECHVSTELNLGADKENYMKTYSLENTNDLVSDCDKNERSKATGVPEFIDNSISFHPVSDHDYCSSSSTVVAAGECSGYQLNNSIDGSTCEDEMQQTTPQTGSFRSSLSCSAKISTCDKTDDNHSFDENCIKDENVKGEIPDVDTVSAVIEEVARSNSIMVSKAWLNNPDNFKRSRKKPINSTIPGKSRTRKKSGKNSSNSALLNTDLKTNSDSHKIVSAEKRKSYRKNSMQDHEETRSTVNTHDINSLDKYEDRGEPLTNFECICGEIAYDKDECVLIVECCVCASLQHAACVNYDLRDPLRGHYLCPHCHVHATPVVSGATLIISPSSICHQWVEEIQKHVREESLNVIVYSGVNKQGFVQPQTLAHYDIVITSYETLRKEIDYVDLPHSKSEAGRRFRNPKRFMAIPSPIIAVDWWRICLDEAQMVETTSTKTAEMALRLHGVNRWCVTGTPIQRGIDDLFGLFLFLGVDPYWVQYWWKTLLYLPFCAGQPEAMVRVLSDTLWRTAKKDVLDQICLPTQTEEVHWLTFSPVEEHFYRRQYQDCATLAKHRLSKWTDKADFKLCSLDRYTLHQLLFPLLRLRQACCHPQALKGEFMPIHKSTMTMDELLKQLIKKAKLECEESHRQIIFAFNGLAALHILQKEPANAVDKYRMALRSVEEHKAELRTDELQQLHTLFNLHEILQSKPQGVPPTLRDSQLQEQCAEIKTKYLQRFLAQVIQAQDTWAPVSKTLQELTQQFRRGRGWWAELIKWAISCNMDTLLVEKIKDDLAENRQPNTHGLSLLFREARGLQYVLGTHIQELQETHETLVNTLRGLTVEPSPQLIQDTVQCCLRPTDNVLKTCPFCQAQEIFDGYESKLFCFVDKGVTEAQPVEGEDGAYAVNPRRQGTWADSDTEKALKSLISFSKMYGGNRQLLEFGGVHIKLLDALKKEFKCLRTLWLYLRERVSALDELDMATTRMRLRLPDEEKTDPPQPNVLEPSEIDRQQLKLQSDLIVGKNELKKKLGQLLYLKNLATAETEMEGGQNPSPCPICQRKLGSKWSVLLCGHCFCLECIRILVDQYSFGGHNRTIKCPVCRQRSTHAEICYVSTKASDNDNNSGKIKVKGDNSTKVEGVVRCLLTIQQREPQAKTLVFSTWTTVLDVLAMALTENNITYKSLHVSHKFQQNLDIFKHSSEVSVLLLPIHSGANGLNLIEATHVILVEPILNVAQELQAIGRVHRIGQTKPTVVHRFLVGGTIEERMATLLSAVQPPTNSHNTEETTLTIGELSSLFNDIPVATDDDDEDDENNMLIAHREHQDAISVNQSVEESQQNLEIRGSQEGEGVRGNQANSTE